MKYTKEILETVVKDCVSIAGVLRNLGLKEAGGTHSHISRRIREFEIDTSHFLGQRANCGLNHKGSRKTPWQEILVLHERGRRQKAYILRRALIESGREYKCEAEGCLMKSDWLGKPIMLHVNHKNGSWLDDRPENIEFICPNCHSQTSNYCGSKGFAELTSSAKFYRAYRNKKKGPVAK